jgi:hypothetical protein
MIYTDGYLMASIEVCRNKAGSFLKVHGCDNLLTNWDIIDVIPMHIALFSDQHNSTISSFFCMLGIGY